MRMKSEEHQETLEKLTRVEEERDAAVKWIRVVIEELILAGYGPPGDRNIALANLRLLCREREIIRADNDKLRKDLVKADAEIRSLLSWKEANSKTIDFWYNRNKKAEANVKALRKSHAFWHSEYDLCKAELDKAVIEIKTLKASLAKKSKNATSRTKV